MPSIEVPGSGIQRYREAEMCPGSDPVNTIYMLSQAHPTHGSVLSLLNATYVLRAVIVPACLYTQE